jgi:hypothetical protein
MFALRKNHGPIKYSYSIVPKNLQYLSLEPKKKCGKTTIQKIYYDSVKSKTIPLYYFYTTILFGLGILYIYNKHGKISE